MATTTARTVVIDRQGGPEELRLVDLPVGDPGPGQIRIRHMAVGLNYIDVYHRNGLYKLTMPHALGMEAAGVVEAVGPGVTHLKEGDRAAYASMPPPGAYTEARVMPAAQVCPLPDGISFEDAAAAMLQGMTVEYLFHRVTPIARGERVLFHAAAGGVGLIACQWGKSEGIELIGTAGGPDKCRLAAEAGAAHVIDYRAEDFVSRVKEITGGSGVPYVIDGVGRDTFDKSLDCIAPLGWMISFGNASGPVDPVSLLTLAAKGSLKLTRTTLFTFIADHARCQDMARHLFDKMLSGAVKITIGQRFPLDRIADAHRALEGRATTGSTIITL